MGGYAPKKPPQNPVPPSLRQQADETPEQRWERVRSEALEPCPECYGAGELERPWWHDIVESILPFLDLEPPVCRRCGGSGNVSRYSSVVYK